MWCTNCRQDVPGIASPKGDGGIHCASCRTVISAGSKGDGAPTAGAADGDRFDSQLFAAPPVDLDDWDLEDDFHEVDHLVDKIQVHHNSAAGDGPAPGAEDDPISTWHMHLKQPPALPSSPLIGQEHRPKTKKPSSMMSWTSLSIGLMSFVCGGVLLVWAFMAGRGDLWVIGMPLALIGQAAILVGVVFQMDGLWKSNRDTSETLDDLDDKLHDLKHTTTMLGTTRSGAAQSFYAHMAEGASPNLLLADLKGQMDMLAVKMSRERQ